MLLERIVYICLCIVLLCFISKKYFETKNSLSLPLLAFQIISILVEILSLFKGAFPNQIIQLFILIFAIIIPAFIFATNYLKINLSELIDIKLGDFRASKGDYNAAIELYKKAIAKNPHNSESFVKIARAYNAIGDRRTAFDRFAKAVELNRNDYKSYYEIGIIFNELNKKADAQVVLDNALRIKPDYTPASELLALVLCAQNKYDEAIHVYEDAIKYNPDNYQLHYSLGIVRTELRDFNDALESYKKAILLKPDLYEAYFSMGQIYLLKGELDEAEKYFKESIQSHEIAAKSYYQIAKINILKENEIGAVNNIEYAVEIDPSFRYKAETEPLFKNIKDYLTGLHMVSQAQMKLEKAIDEKVKKEYEREEMKIHDINEDEVEFNFMDKYNSKD